MRKVQQFLKGLRQVFTNIWLPKSSLKEQFTDRIGHALSLAQQEAKNRQHRQVDVEHIFVALFRAEDSVASRVLRDLKIDAEQVFAFSDYQEETTDVSPELVQRGIEALAMALNEARRMGHHSIGTDHLLLGLMNLTDNAVTRFLASINIPPESISQYVYQVLEETRPDFAHIEQFALYGPLTIRIRDNVTGEEKATFTLALIEVARLVEMVYELEQETIQFTHDGQTILFTTKGIDKPD